MGQGDVSIRYARPWDYCEFGLKNTPINLADTRSAISSDTLAKSITAS
jgi:hypothetical protein